MMYLLGGLAVILCCYVFFMFLVMKRYMSWRYKAFIYGFLTFSMLIGVFLIFACYSKYWK
jgi:hypothetical protein